MNPHATVGILEGSLEAAAEAVFLIDPSATERWPNRESAVAEMEQAAIQAGIGLAGEIVAGRVEAPFSGNLSDGQGIVTLQVIAFDARTIRVIPTINPTAVIDFARAVRA